MSKLIDAEDFIGMLEWMQMEIADPYDSFEMSMAKMGVIDSVIGLIKTMKDDNPNKWILCKDILPPDSKEVLICTNETIWIASRFTDRPWEMWEYKDGSLGDISERDCWMPLPKPYKE